MHLFEKSLVDNFVLDNYSDDFRYRMALSIEYRALGFFYRLSQRDDPASPSLYQKLKVVYSFHW